MRIQKYLARVGVASRREVERWISENRVGLNGVSCKPGDQVVLGDVITVDGQIFKVTDVEPPVRIIAYHKRLGEMVTRSDPANRPLAVNALPPIDIGRWISVGRLDVNTTGLLLFTNHGELANALMHPGSNIEREYLCRVFGSVSGRELERLRRGVKSKNETLRFDEIDFVKGKGLNQWYRIVLKRGKNREIRRAWEAIGFQVNRLQRIRYGEIHLDDSLKPGDWKELGQHAVDQVMQSVEI